MASSVAFEVDDIDDAFSQVWSVLVVGRSRAVTDHDEGGGMLSPRPPVAGHHFLLGSQERRAWRRTRAAASPWPGLCVQVKRAIGPQCPAHTDPADASGWTGADARPPRRRRG
ncbi:hypothetical protein ACWD4J_18295 [Streptomyces sp. NPDC002577]